MAVTYTMPVYSITRILLAGCRCAIAKQRIIHLRPCRVFYDCKEPLLSPRDGSQRQTSHMRSAWCIVCSARRRSKLFIVKLLSRKSRTRNDVFSCCPSLTHERHT